MDGLTESALLRPFYTQVRHEANLHASKAWREGAHADFCSDMRELFSEKSSIKKFGIAEQCRKERNALFDMSERQRRSETSRKKTQNPEVFENG